MKVILPKDFVSSFVWINAKALPVLCEKLLNSVSRWGATEADVDTTKLILDGDLDEGLSEDRLTELLLEHAQAKSYNAIYRQVLSVRNIIKDPGGPPKSLHALEAALIRYFKKDAIDGWIYRRMGDGNFLAYVVGSIDHITHTKAQKEEGAVDYVILRYTANTTAHSLSGGYSQHNRGSNSSITWGSEVWEEGSYRKRTIHELLAEKGLYHETSELKADYLN